MINFNPDFSFIFIIDEYFINTAMRKPPGNPKLICFLQILGLSKKNQTFHDAEITPETET